MPARSHATTPASPSRAHATTPPSRTRGERGQALSAFVVVVVVALLLVAGLVVDGGAKAAASRRVHSAAAQAARAAVDAGATARVSGSAPTTGDVRAAGERVLAERGVTGTVTIAAGRVRVEASTSADTVFLSLIGVRTLTASADAEADLRTP